MFGRAAASEQGHRVCRSPAQHVVPSYPTVLLAHQQCRRLVEAVASSTRHPDSKRREQILSLWRSPPPVALNYMCLLAKVIRTMVVHGVQSLKNDLITWLAASCKLAFIGVLQSITNGVAWFYEHVYACASYAVLRLVYLKVKN